MDYKQKRKVHDIWAVILFIIATAACNTIYFMMKPEKPFFHVPPRDLIIASVFYVLSAMSLVSLLLLLIPAFMMHAAFFIFPVLSIGLAVYLKETYSIVTSIIVSIISLVLYFFVYRKNIKYSAQVVKSATSLLLRNSLAFFPVILICVASFLTQIFIAAKYLDTQYEKNYFLYMMFILQMYWVFFTFIYIVRVFVSSVIALEILTVQEEVSIYFESFKNTLYSLGSVCFGALIIALVSTLRHLHNESHRRSESSRGGEILYLIVSIILAFLQEIVAVINDFTFCYLAIYGKPYIQSIKGAFEIAKTSSNSLLINSLCVIEVLNLFSLVISLGYVGLIYLMKNGLKTNEQWISAICAMFVVLSIISVFLNSFDSAVKAFLFTYDKEPISVKNKFPKTYEALEIQKTKS